MWQYPIQDMTLLSVVQEGERQGPCPHWIITIKPEVGLGWNAGSGTIEHMEIQAEPGLWSWVWVI